MRNFIVLRHTFILFFFFFFSSHFSCPGVRIADTLSPRCANMSIIILLLPYASLYSHINCYLFTNLERYVHLPICILLLSLRVHTGRIVTNRIIVRGKYLPSGRFFFFYSHSTDTVVSELYDMFNNLDRTIAIPFHIPSV